MAKKTATKQTPKKRREWKPRFLEALSASPNVSAAALVAGCNRQYAYQVRETDAEFARAWDDAIEQSTDNAVGEAYRRAVDGVEKPVFGSLGGQLGSGEVGKIREYSDTLLIFLLKSHRPRTYREKVEITGDDAKPVAFRVVEIETLRAAVGVASVARRSTGDTETPG